MIFINLYICHVFKLFKRIPTVLWICIACYSQGFALTGSEVYKLASKSMYTVEVYSQGRALGKGSAVAIGTDTLITNCHVIEGGDKIYIKNNKGLYFATLYKTFQLSDLCLLKVPDLKLIPVQMKYSNSLEVGSTVYAIGSPYGLPNSFSQGVLSQKRPFQGNVLLQTDTSISPGSSGGGLFNNEGELIGITTLKLKEIGMAVSIDMFIPYSVNENYSEMKSEQMLNETVIANDEPVAIDNDKSPEPRKTTKYEYIEQTTTITTYGVYGKSKIILGRDIYGCWIYLPGKLDSGSIYGSAVIYPEFNKSIFIFPRSATMHEAINSTNKVLVSIANGNDNYGKYSSSKIKLVDQRYKPPHVKKFDLVKVDNNLLKKDSFVGMFEFDILRQFIEDEDFYVEHVESRGQRMVSFGLWGFSDALSNYSKCMTTK